MNSDSILILVFLVGLDLGTRLNEEQRRSLLAESERDALAKVERAIHIIRPVY